MTDIDPAPIGRLLRRPGSLAPLPGARPVQIDDPRLAEVLAADATPLLLHEGTLHAEGPVWQPARNRLLFSDVPNRRLIAWYADDNRVETVLDGTFFMNGNALEPAGTLVHAEHGRRCISRSAADDTQPTPIVTHYEGRRINTPNDLTVAADGAIWFTDPTFGLLMPNQGSLREPELDHRSVYRFDPASRALRRMADFEQPNGIAFSPDGRTLYVSDTSISLNEIPGRDVPPGDKHEIIAFDVAPDQSLSNRRFFCRTDHGYPDGFAVDARGWVWTAAADGVHVWSADRTRLGYIPTPHTVANTCFGGPGNTRLFIAATSQVLAIDLR